MRRALAAAVALASGCGGFDGIAFHARYAREGTAAPRLDCAQLAGVEVIDAQVGERVNVENNGGRVVGVRSQERTHRVRERLAMVGLVNQWVTDGIDSHLEAIGIASQGGRARLVVALTGVVVNESYNLTASYFGRVSLGARLVAPDGSVCAEVAQVGEGRNDGMQKSERNLTQTANRALDVALEELFSEGAMRQALCTCGR